MVVPGLNGETRHRWLQDVKVVRGDRIAHYVVDYGPAEDFERIPPLIIAGVGEDTVGEAQEAAERHRHDTRWWKHQQERLAGSTLIEDNIRQLSIDAAVRHNRSQFGPAVSVQRGSYPRQTVLRGIRDMRDKRSGRKQF